MKKQSEKAMQTKAALISAFWELYRGNPIEKITVKNVTDSAGVYRSTFYLYFQDVYAILEQIENDIIHNWKIKLFEAHSKDKNINVVDIIADFFDENGEYLSVILSSKGNPMFIQKIKDTTRPFWYELFNLCDNDVKSSLIFEYIISARLAFFAEWYRNAKHISKKEAATIFHTLATETTTSAILRLSMGEI